MIAKKLALVGRRLVMARLAPDQYAEIAGVVCVADGREIVSHPTSLTRIDRRLRILVLESFRLAGNNYEKGRPMEGPHGTASFAVTLPHTCAASLT